MKLYNSIGPNPQVVRMFLAEKGITVPLEKVDLRAGENRKEPHLLRNPHGQMPTLELDNGSYISEIVPICEYIEEKHPSPPLIGTTPEERGECRMWTRRIDLNICEPMANGFRFAEGLKFFESRILTAMDRAIELKNTTQPNMRVVNMSLGGVTLNAGGDVEDELASSMAAAGISLVASSGNTGPSGMTVGSPGRPRRPTPKSLCFSCWMLTI